jgi:histidinol-phosphate aminotransferase
MTAAPPAETVMAYEYEKTIAARSGLRLHLNENTAGCSPKVVAALGALTREDFAYYPDYDRTVATAAARLNVPEQELILTNGLDEGILAAAVCSFRSRGTAVSDLEAIIVVPAFDMYAVCSDAMGARLVNVPLNADFSFPRQRVLDAVTARTRLIFLTNPNNPTGQVIPREDILAVVRAAPNALIFLDEAYGDFSDASMMSDAEARALPNLLIGRTFAKAYGLAGLRAGAVVGNAATLAPFRQIVPPFSLNVCASVALTAAFEDIEYYDWYLEQVHSSKALLYQALDRLGVRYWRSAANFVLADFGNDARRVVEGLAARGVYVRDRTKDPASPGCVRVTTGVTAHTQALIDALEEVLCAAE